MASLPECFGHSDIASEYLTLAQEYAIAWEKLADDGDHTRLTFDHPDTWSLKYNLVWDRLLRYNLFSVETARREVAFYLKHRTLTEYHWTAVETTRNRTGFWMVRYPGGTP